MKTSAFASVALLAVAAVALTTAQAQEPRPSTITAPANRSAAAPTEPAKSGHVAINGINYYYEIHGRGEPLLLLHGGLLSIDLMRPIIPALAKHRQVIGVDLQGHGRTDLGSRPISLIDSGNDLSVLLAETRLPAGGCARLFIRRWRWPAPGHPASRTGAAAGRRLSAVRAGRFLSRDAAAAGGGERRDRRRDERDADVQVVRERGTAPAGFSAAARSHGGVHARRPTTGRPT